MMARCYNRNDKDFKHYGRRGISVCKRWHDIRNFIKDNDGKKLPGLSLDRTNNDGPYSPRNTRWVTHRAQKLNIRPNVRLTLRGRTQCAAEWARELGWTAHVIWTRLKGGWSVEETLTTPPGKRRISKLITVNGIPDTLAGHARRAGLDHVLVWLRINKLGWTAEEALAFNPHQGPQRHAARITYKGVKDTLPNHARRVGLMPNVVRMRIKKYGWSIEDALATD